MKRFLPKLFALISAGAVFSFAGCGSTKVTREQLSPMAVLSVSCNQTLPYYEADLEDEEFTGKDGVLETAINKFLMKNNPELLTNKDRADYADSEFYRVMEETAGISIIPKETLLSSEIYSNISRSIFDYDDTQIRASNYRPMNAIGAKKARLLIKELNAASLAFIDFRFNKSLVKGTKFNGEVGAVATLNIKIQDSTGKVVIDDQFVVRSSVTTPVYRLEYDRDELIDMFEEVIETAYNQFIMKYFF